MPPNLFPTEFEIPLSDGRCELWEDFLNFEEATSILKEFIESIEWCQECISIAGKDIQGAALTGTSATAIALDCTDADDSCGAIGEPNNEYDQGEDFVDENGNGIWDEGEEFTDEVEYNYYDCNDVCG